MLRFASARFPVGPKQDSGPFWIGSGLAILSALVTYFGIPEVPENHMSAFAVTSRAFFETDCSCGISS